MRKPVLPSPAATHTAAHTAARLRRLARRPRAPASAQLARGGLSLGGMLPGQAPSRGWLWSGALVGGLLALASQLPASWLAGWVAGATEGRLQLAEAEGTLWHGSALPVLTGGPGSKDARVMPSRLAWRLSPLWLGLGLQLTQPCCMAGGARLELRTGWRRMQLTLTPLSTVGGAGGSDTTLGQWPAAWLEGLGAPWNTVKPGGQLRLASPGLTLSQQAGGAWQVQGSAELQLLQTSSRLAPVDPLGSYRISLTAPSQPGQPPVVQLQTLEGALQLQGQGELRPGGLHFRGDARAAPGQEPALNNLLNIIGRRQGASSVISIG
ncbi:type II secretion system protein N [Ideonella azotifigens]|uniref:type II secretion system protein N n=1 Tax=Ideonella azotifigens TaxID=513160 RepID=UPI001E6077E5|nr:type II secretion system protein N [Ideonella azotifigens]MCD2339439.1 type II secretion system protein N [Ideonella azotifigens]